QKGGGRARRPQVLRNLLEGFRSILLHLATGFQSGRQTRVFGLKQASSGPRSSIPWSSLFVGAIWALMLILAIFLVLDYGSMVPFWDDWNLVPWLTGEQPVTISWLWEQAGEHRFFLPKLILVSALKLSGADFRVGMYINVLAMAGLGLGFILAARAVRGKTTCADAFFPIVLLHRGHVDSFLWTSVNTY